MPRMKATLPTITPLVNVRLDLTPEQREQLRVAAAKAGVPMSQFARDAVLTAIRAKK